MEVSEPEHLRYPPESASAGRRSLLMHRSGSAPSHLTPIAGRLEMIESKREPEGF